MCSSAKSCLNRQRRSIVSLLNTSTRTDLDSSLIPTSPTETPYLRFYQADLLPMAQLPMATKTIPFFASPLTLAPLSTTTGMEYLSSLTRGLG